jgi:hypothetical protein
MFSKKPSMEEFAADFAQDNIEEIFKQIASYEYKYGKEFSENLTFNFIASFIGAMVYQELKQRKKGSTVDEAYERASETFMRLKSKTQQAVAAGFQSSINTFTGKNIEYYCKIEPIPEPPTKVIQ